MKIDLIAFDADSWRDIVKDIQQMAAMTGGLSQRLKTLEAHVNAGIKRLQGEIPDTAPTHPQVELTPTPEILPEA